MSEEEKINRLLNSIAKGCDGNIADEVKAIIIKQQKEIEEKTTIIMAGAEKVKQLEKEIQRLEKDNDTLSELVIVNEDKVIKELDLISKDKIREKIKELEEQMQQDEVDEFGIHSIGWGTLDYVVEQFKELLKENDE